MLVWEIFEGFVGILGVLGEGGGGGFGFTAVWDGRALEFGLCRVRRSASRLLFELFEGGGGGLHTLRICSELGVALLLRLDWNISFTLLRGDPEPFKP